MSVETKSKSAAAKKAVTHPNTWVFYNGEFGRYHDIKLGLMTHALHYGTGCFEGIRAYWNEKHEQLHLLHAPAHYERLRRSANIMRMTVPYSTEELVNLTVDLLRLFYMRRAKRSAFVSTTSTTASSSMRFPLATTSRSSRASSAW